MICTCTVICCGSGLAHAWGLLSTQRAASFQRGPMPMRASLVWLSSHMDTDACLQASAFLSFASAYLLAPGICQRPRASRDVPPPTPLTCSLRQLCAPRCMHGCMPEQRSGVHLCCGLWHHCRACLDWSHSASKSHHWRSVKTCAVLAHGCGGGCVRMDGHTSFNPLRSQRTVVGGHF